MTEYEKGRADEKAAIVAYLNETRRRLYLIATKSVRGKERQKAKEHVDSIDQILKAIGNNPYSEDSSPPAQGN